MKTKRSFRLGVCGVFLGTACLGLALPALAWQQPLWVQQLGTAEADSALGVATDGAGNVYIAGATAGSLAGPPQGGDDAWVAKYSPAGALRWKQQLGTKEHEFAAGVATDSAGNVYIAGTTLGPLAGRQQGNGDAWVAKYSPAGVLRWKQQLGTKESDTAKGVATDGAGNVYIAGTTLGPLAGRQQGNGDAWVAKYSPAGVLRWKRQLGTKETEIVNGLATDGAGNVIIAGDAYALEGGGWVGWLAKYSPAGAIRWKQQYTYDGFDLTGITGVTTDKDDNVYIAGWTGTVCCRSIVAKYSSGGAFLWQEMGPDSYIDPSETNAIAVDQQGNIYVSGAIHDFETNVEASAFVAKFLPTGALHWQRVLGVLKPADAFGVATDVFGNVYIAGVASVTADWSSPVDAFVAKYVTRR